ncbi:MAG: alanine racemase [Anaerolineales bacterium]|nr:alanine racemase [Anaerolineales bacterium]
MSPEKSNEPVRPTYLEVDLSRLKKNIESIRARVGGAKVMPMVKANAYGHGVEGVAPFLEPLADMLGVALVEEGAQLRRLGIKKPILVTGGTLLEQLPLYFEHDLTLTASSLDLLLAADHLAESTRQRLTVHLLIDTGMERVGVHHYAAEQFILRAASLKHVNVEGIYTHLANAELVSVEGLPSRVVTARRQLERFQEVLALYEKHSLPAPPLRHICNSGGIMNLPEGYLDMVRPGILTYGIYPGRDIPKTLDLQPIAVWRSRVLYSKIAQPGSAVSYGSLWQVEGSPRRIVTVPCGYADGYLRVMSNRARVLVNGKSYPQVGRVCMDLFMADLGDDDAAVGDEVVLLGEGIAPEELAAWQGTNEYEVMTNISARVPRVFINGVE